MILRLVSVLLLLAVGGCGEDEGMANPVGSGRSGGRPTVEGVAKAGMPTNIAVVIGGRVISRREICRNGKSALILAMNKVRKTKIGRAEFKIFRRYCRTAVRREINQAAVAAYVKERGLQISKQDLARQEWAFTRKYGVRSKKLKRWHTLGDLKYILGKNAALADADILAMARYAAMTNDLFRRQPVVVTDRMASDRIRSIERQNKIVASTNALVFARATNVWQRIVRKEMTFEAAATNYSEDAYLAEGCEWGCFSREQLEGETALLGLLPGLKPGDITPPIESDGGLAIVRKDADDDKRTYSFSRVYFKLPMRFDVETPAEAKAYLADELMRQRIRETVSNYVGKLKIEYPNGTNVMDNVTFSDLK